MFKKTLAFGLLAASTLTVAIAPANASEVQRSDQVIGSTTVAVDDSHALSYNTQESYEGIYEGYGYIPYYGDHEAQVSRQGIHSTTVAVDDSFAYSDNEQYSVLENHEEGSWWAPYYH
jgi:hypothetical protein